MEQARWLVAVLLVLALFLLAGFCMLLIWLSRLRRKREIGRMENEEYATLKLHVPACDYPDIPEQYAVGPIEFVVPKTVKKRSDLMTQFIGKGIDTRRAIERSYVVDDITGMGFYEFKQEM